MYCQITIKSKKKLGHLLTFFADPSLLLDRSTTSKESWVLLQRSSSLRFSFFLPCLDVKVCVFIQNLQTFASLMKAPLNFFFFSGDTKSKVFRVGKHAIQLHFLRNLTLRFFGIGGACWWRAVPHFGPCVMLPAFSVPNKGRNILFGGSVPHRCRTDVTSVAS